MNYRNHWTDLLKGDIRDRLYNCTSKKGDIRPLTEARYTFMKTAPGYTREQALVDILDYLDSNGRFFDLTGEEWDRLAGKISLTEKPEEIFTNLATISKESGKEYVIIDHYPEIDYTLIYRNHPYEPWVAAWCYIPERQSWSQGHYFTDLLGRTAYIKGLIEERAGRR